ncbi:MAG: thioesterase [Anaerolineales bacterium]|nr:thioesterase [Anaerolineales bacterium]
MLRLQRGLRGEKKMVVKRQDLASYAGNIGAEVLSTHRGVLLMEQAVRNTIENFLPEGKITVGTSISIEHFAATPPGVKVRAEAFLKEINGRRLFFDIVVRDEFEEIARGQNEQIIVSADRFLETVKQKEALARTREGA